MKDPKEYSLEALKLINDWCKWLITLVTGMIAALSFIYEKRINVIPWEISLLTVCALVCFFFCVSCAVGVLYRLPGVAQSLPEQNENEKNIYFMGGDSYKGRFTLGTVMGFQQLFFIIGLFIFMIAFSLLLLYYRYPA